MYQWVQIKSRAVRCIHRVVSLNSLALGITRLRVIQNGRVSAERSVKLEGRLDINVPSAHLAFQGLHSLIAKGSSNSKYSDCTSSIPPALRAPEGTNCTGILKTFQKSRHNVIAGRKRWNSCATGYKHGQECQMEQIE